MKNEIRIKGPETAAAYLESIGCDVPEHDEKGNYSCVLPCDRCGGIGLYPSSWYKGLCLECTFVGRPTHTRRHFNIVDTARKAKSTYNALAKRKVKAAERANEKAAAAAIIDRIAPAALDALRGYFTGGWVKDWAAYQAAVAELATPHRVHPHALSKAVRALRKPEAEALKKEAKAKMAYVGTVGKRADFTVTVVAEIYLGRNNYGSTRYLYLFDDADGNRITWVASKRLGEFVSVPETHESYSYEEFRAAKAGDRIDVKATVKEQKLYKDTPQTVVSRAKLIRFHEVSG